MRSKQYSLNIYIYIILYIYIPSPKNGETGKCPQLSRTCFVGYRCRYKCNTRVKQNAHRNLVQSTGYPKRSLHEKTVNVEHGNKFTGNNGLSDYPPATTHTCPVHICKGRRQCFTHQYIGPHEYQQERSYPSVLCCCSCSLLCCVLPLA